jgi:hypothetical protein
MTLGQLWGGVSQDSARQNVKLVLQAGSGRESRPDPGLWTLGRAPGRSSASSMLERCSLYVNPVN